MKDVNVPALVVFVLFFALVTVMGFLASRWRRADDAAHLDEWGLGGRSFGTWVTWFLLGGDLYTAYTFVAVPAAVYATGAAGFFAVPYTIVAYPLVFLFLPRLWSVSRVHGYVTPADFVRGRYGSRPLSLVVALTGILATMPYIALQLVGIQAVLDVLGVGGGEHANWFVKDLPLFIAFGVLAAYTYSSGLRAPALIAFVKDALIYIVIIVAVIYIPIRLGGYGHIFDAAAHKFSAPKSGGSMTLPDNKQWTYATLALGSAMALFMYPHSVTGVLASKSRNTVRRNMAIMPAYSLMLGLLALLGFMAIAAGVGQGDKKFNAQLSVPQLFADMFPDWFTGVAFAAIGIGALVPAAIMSIAAANLFTRNVYKEWLKPTASPRTRPGSPSWSHCWSRSARWSSCSAWTSRPRSTSSCSAACGSCRPSWRSSAACSPAGSTTGRCSPAGRPAWRTAPGRRTASPARPPSTSAATRPRSPASARSATSA